MRPACHVLLRSDAGPAALASSAAVEPADTASPSHSTTDASQVASVAARGGSKPSPVEPSVATVPGASSLSSALPRSSGGRSVTAAAFGTRGT